jgi:hypothetical protein
MIAIVSCDISSRSFRGLLQHEIPTRAFGGIQQLERQLLTRRQDLDAQQPFLRIQVEDQPELAIDARLGNASLKICEVDERHSPES